MAQLEGEIQTSIELPPHASSMVESMRDIGYSFPAAIADIVDNCISATARRVSINFLWRDGDPVLAIADDGMGMAAHTLLEAMRPGTRHPRGQRAATDLGRFGLGLKTASFSQCRRLSVVSRTDGGELAGYCWDLDYVEETNAWSVQPLSAQAIKQLPFRELLGNHGTLVVWEKIDRLMDFTSQRAEDLFNDHFDEARDHLQLVFHRFLEPMADEKHLSRVRIEMNGLALKAFNPFFPDADARQLLVTEDIYVEGELVRIQPYVLPHHSRVGKDSYERYAGKEGYAHTQGFYVYRNRRLIDHGTWFGLIPKREITRLARVRIDIPNTLDHLWGIDVRKSRAAPPGVIRDSLKRVIGRITESASKVYTHRGKKAVSQENAPIWQRLCRHGTIHYTVNQEHPLLVSLRKEMGNEQNRQLNMFMRLVGENIPADMIFSDMSGDPSSLDVTGPSDGASLRVDLRSLIAVLRESGFDEDAIREHLGRIRPYSAHPALVAEVLGENI